MKKKIIPKEFFNIERNIITNKKAMKGVIPVDWEKALKDRHDNQNEVVLLKQFLPEKRV